MDTLGGAIGHATVHGSTKGGPGAGAGWVRSGLEVTCWLFVDNSAPVVDATVPVGFLISRDTDPARALSKRSQNSQHLASVRTSSSHQEGVH